jgi:hypothetical protein
MADHPAPSTALSDVIQSANFSGGRLKVCGLNMKSMGNPHEATIPPGISQQKNQRPETTFQTSELSYTEYINSRIISGQGRRRYWNSVHSLVVYRDLVRWLYCRLLVSSGKIYICDRRRGLDPWFFLFASFMVHEL